MAFHRSETRLLLDATVDQGGTLIRAEDLSRERAVHEEAAKTILFLHYNVCQVGSLSLLPHIIYACVWCTYTRGGGGVKFD